MDSVLINLTVNLLTSGVIITLLVQIYHKLGRLEEHSKWTKERIDNHEQRIRELEKRVFERT